MKVNINYIKMCQEADFIHSYDTGEYYAVPNYMDDPVNSILMIHCMNWPNDNSIWLPSREYFEEQLAKDYMKKGGRTTSPRTILESLMWCYDALHLDSNISMEELFIITYMFLVENKIWKNEKWVKVK